MHMLSKLVCYLIIVFIVATCAAQETEKGSSDVMLQGYHWESHMTNSWWEVIAAKANDIAASGITMVWFPPSSGSASIEGYLPHKLYDQNGGYGNQQQLQKAIQSLHAVGVKAIADIVINHRVGTSDWADFTDPNWGSDAVCSNDEWAGASGNNDTGEGYGAARDIDHTQSYVQDSIKDWMKWLKNGIGYDGWRYDYSKGYSGYYVKLYNEATSPIFSVGEFWDNLDINNYNPHRQQLCDWINATGQKSTAFDFTTKGMLQQAVRYSEYWRLRDSEGKPCGLIGWWPAKAVTFIDNHDTGPSTGGSGGQNHWPFPGDKVMEGYAYILTHPRRPLRLLGAFL